VGLKQVLFREVRRDPGGERAETPLLTGDHFFDQGIRIPELAPGGQDQSSGARAAASRARVHGWTWLRPPFLEA
jgi:hypothetical protein